MNYEENRLDSFDSLRLTIIPFDFVVSLRLTKAGFYYLGLGHTECFWCGLYKQFSFWEEGHDPETVHREESLNCEFVTGQSGNVPIVRWMRYEQYWLRSFPPWWLEDNQLDASDRQHLAKAGFYRTIGDDTKCFSCGLYKCVTFWLEGHDPETVHRELSPNCKFITGQSDNVPINNSNFFTKILHYVWSSLTSNRKTLNNKMTTQQVAAKEQIDNQFESYSQGSIVNLVTDTNVKHNKISQEIEKEAKFRNPRNDVRPESIEESTVEFTFPEPDVGNKKAASGSTCRWRHLISATRGSCSSQEINQNSVIFSQSSQSSAFTTQTITSFDISERRSPIVSPIAILCLAVYYKSHIFLHFLIQLL